MSGTPLTEFRALIDPDCLRVTRTPANLLQWSNQILPSIAKSAVEHRDEPGKRIDDRQQADFTSGGQRIMNKIHRPDLVRPRCWTTIFPKFRFDTSFWRLSPQREALVPVEPIPVTCTGLTDLLNVRRKLGLLRTARPVRVGRSLDLKDSAGAPDRHAPISSTPIDQIPLPGRP